MRHFLAVAKTYEGALHLKEAGLLQTGICILYKYRRPASQNGNSSTTTAYSRHESVTQPLVKATVPLRAKASPVWKGASQGSVYTTVSLGRSEKEGSVSSYLTACPSRVAIEHRRAAVQPAGPPTLHPSVHPFPAWELGPLSLPSAGLLSRSDIAASQVCESEQSLHTTLRRRATPSIDARRGATLTVHRHSAKHFAPSPNTAAQKDILLIQQRDYSVTLQGGFPG